MTLARTLGLESSSKGCIRIALTGASSGIGHACMELLRPYDSVEFLSLGRRQCSSCHFSLDLSDPKSVDTVVGDLVKQWFRKPANLLPGCDIFINNSGVFYSSNIREGIMTNLVSPCYMTETLARAFKSQNNNSRKLRFVQVVSRLEKKSVLNRGTLMDWFTSCINNSGGLAPVDLYSDTKRALILHTAFASNTADKSVSYIAVTPGMVNTPLGMAGAGRLVWWLSAPIRFLLLRHPIEGAVSVLFAAFGYPGETGIYTADPNEVLECISETRDTTAGEIVSDCVNRFYRSL